MSEPDDDHHEHQAHTGDVEGTLPEIDAAILFPSLGAPCVVELGGAEFVEVLIATRHAQRLSIGNIAHYLGWRTFTASRDSRARAGRAPVPPREPPDPDRLQWIHAGDIFLAEQSWPLLDLARGQADQTDLRTEDLDGAPLAPSPPAAGGGTPAERAVHKGRDATQVALDHPIFPITTCRLHSFVVDLLKDHYPEVHRILIRAASLPTDALCELVWTSVTPRAAYLAKLKEYAGSSAARGKHLKDDAYDELEMRHPFLIRRAPVTAIAHLTDIHNSAAHNLLNLSQARVLEDGAPDAAYSPPVGARFNNYNRDFSRLCAQLEANTDAYVLTGDLVDYGRGLWYPNSDAGNDARAAWMPAMLRAGEDGFPDSVATAAPGAPSPMPTVSEIWDQMGGHEQLQYVTDANFKYFIEHKIVPRLLAGKPVFTCLGNHDFHPHPFTPWPTENEGPNETSYNPFTPSDYNLTRYEALLAYGPNSFDTYKMSAVWFTMLGFEGGGAGVVSTPNCCGIYFCFVNPWVDLSVRFGDRSLLLLDFGRLEVRPQGITRSFFRTGLMLAVIGALAVLAGIGLFALGNSVGGPWGTLLKILGVALAVLGALAIIGGIVTMAGTAGAGALMEDFEDTDSLPAAQTAMNDAQVDILEAWVGRSDATTRAVFCHALVAGRPPRMVSIDQLNAHPEAARLDKMKYGILAHEREHIIGHLRDRKIAVTMSGHSHYTSIYRLQGDAPETRAEWPGVVSHAQAPAGSAGRGDKMIAVTRASGPMSEINIAQADPMSDGKSAAVDRQLRGPPGASLLTLEAGGYATVEQIECDAPTAQPRRAAFDSWKNRIDHLASGTDDGGPTIDFTLMYLSDAYEPPGGYGSGPRPRPAWPYQLASISFFVGGRRIQAALTPGGGGRPDPDEPPIERARTQSGYQAHRYTFTLTYDEFLPLKTLAGQSEGASCAIEYPDGQDPWIFDVTIDRAGSSLEPVYTVHPQEFPNFEARRRRYQGAA